jgi:hypothetical protein
LCKNVLLSTHKHTIAVACAVLCYAMLCCAVKQMCTRPSGGALPPGRALGHRCTQLSTAGTPPRNWRGTTSCWSTGAVSSQEPVCSHGAAAAGGRCSNMVVGAGYAYWCACSSQHLYAVLRHKVNCCTPHQPVALSTLASSWACKKRAQ